MKLISFIQFFFFLNPVIFDLLQNVNPIPVMGLAGDPPPPPIFYFYFFNEDFKLFKYLKRSLEER